METIKTIVIGASGFSGVELVKLLSGHPSANILAATSTSLAGQAITDIYPHLHGATELAFSELDIGEAGGADVVFLALPHGQAHRLVPQLVAAGGAKIIDLSGDFRLTAGAYAKWYGQEHEAPELLDQATYGLSELNREAISQASIIANPGCFPTGVVLGAAPLVSAGLIAGDLTANCLTGASGAGRTASAATHYCRVDENAAAYKVGGVHQHIPEMEQALAAVANSSAVNSSRPIKVAFTPVLAPMSRGIYSIISATPTETVDLQQLRSLYTNFYQNDHFIRLLDPGDNPESKATAGSNYCHIGLAFDERLGRITVISSIDNLVKGAAGQAVQNMNIIFGLEETAGLTGAGIYP